MHTSPNLTFRQAQAADREVVFAMVATVWDGTDYIPSVWDEWLAADDGPLIVGVLADRPVALCKLSALGPYEDWLGGVRVDPALRGHGIARTLIRNTLDLSRQRGKRTLRFQTSEQNLTMQRLATELGFTLAYAPAWYAAPAVIGTPTYTLLPVTHVPDLLDDLRSSTLLERTGGLYSYRWTAYELTEERLREHAERGEIVRSAGSRAWAILMPSPYGGSWIAHAEGPNAALEPLFHALRYTHQSPDEGAFVRVHVPTATPFIPALLQAGYELGDHAARIYSYQLGD